VEKRKKYFKIDSLSLARALNYLTYNYMKFDLEGKTIYSFEDTDEFRKDLAILNKLRKKNNKYIKQ
jgi:hypothetical protein